MMTLSGYDTISIILSLFNKSLMLAAPKSETIFGQYKYIDEFPL